jgi:hypothetical protein
MAFTMDRNMNYCIYVSFKGIVCSCSFLGNIINYIIRTGPINCYNNGTKKSFILLLYLYHVITSVGIVAWKRLYDSLDKKEERRCYLLLSIRCIFFSLTCFTNPAKGILSHWHEKSVSNKYLGECLMPSTWIANIFKQFLIVPLKATIFKVFVL